MNETNIPTATPALTLKQACYLLHDPTRWLILRELSKGETLPVGELVRRLDCTRDSVSRHLGAMRKLGVVDLAYGQLYMLAPAYRPAPGTATIDFGHFIARLDTPAS